MTSRGVDEDEEHVPIVSSTRHQLDQGSSDQKHGDGPKSGFTLVMATVFLFGELAGTGLLALPKAVENAGVPGMVYLVVNVIVLAYTGIMLTDAWRLVRGRYPEYRDHARYPYAAMGQVTYGRPGRLLVSFCMMVTLYMGSAVVLFILVVDNTGELLHQAGVDVHFNYRSLTIAAIIIPIVCFGTPKDFWPVGVGAAVTSFISGILLVANIAYDGVNQSNRTVEHSTPTFYSFTMALGTMSYLFGGHPILPTIQTDVVDDTNFHYVVLTALFGLAVLLFLISASGYLVYGITIRDNILLNVSPGPVLCIVQSLMTIHFFLAFFIVINPILQEVEDVVNIPREFTWKRCVSRTVTVASIVIVAILVPSFTLIMTLVGGTTMVTLTTLCPSLFFYKLCMMKGEWEAIHLSLGRRMICWAIIVFGVVSGSLSTYSAIHKLVSPSGSPAGPGGINSTARQWSA